MRLSDERIEYWRRGMCDAVASAAKHQAAEHVDIEINHLLVEVTKPLEKQNKALAEELEDARERLGVQDVKLKWFDQILSGNSKRLETENKKLREALNATK